jgi:proteic killer suppression protein
MIRGFRHRGLRRLYERDDRSRLRADQVERIEEILGLLDVASSPRDLDISGLQLHRLRGDLKEYWSLTLSANWRIIFRVRDGEVWDVDLVDYH